MQIVSNRFIGIQSEMKTLSTESEQKISLLSQERDSLQEKVKVGSCLYSYIQFASINSFYYQKYIH